MIGEYRLVEMRVPALIDRKTGAFLPCEGIQLDYKATLDLGRPGSVAETARDILGFSNSQGGLLVLGVDDVWARASRYQASQGECRSVYWDTRRI
jgi:hypothetical protein